MVSADKQTTESSSFNITNVVKFQNMYVDYQQLIAEVAEVNASYWRELNEKSPSIMKLQSFGTQITNQIEDCKAQFKRL